MRRHVMWSPWTAPGLEHLQFTADGAGMFADGVILGVKDQEPFRMRYQIHTDLNWKLHSVRVTVFDDLNQSLHLLTDGEGTWTTADREQIPTLMGCLDVDISATPFTNTLPIRRLVLSAGSSATLSMAYITIPDVTVTVSKQRYTCLETTASGGRYWFESLEEGIASFSAELPVDHNGFVVDYPGLFRRVGVW